MNAQNDIPRDWELDEAEAQMERELRELKPWTASPSLKQRIAEVAAEVEEGAAAEPRADEPGTRVRTLPFWHHRSLAVAAAAVIAFGFLLVSLWLPGDRGGQEVAREGAPAEPGMVSPAEETPDLILWDRVPGTNAAPAWQSDHFLLSSQNEGVVEFEEGPPMWRVRYQLLNRTTWEDAETGAVRERFVPEERVLFVPVRHD